MESHGIDVVITGSQKALALAPGLSVMCFSEKALARIENNSVQSLYFNLKSYLADGERGQTPFTPAVGIINQLKEKTDRLIENGGIDVSIEKANRNALYFRSLIKDLPFDFFADKPSNAVTALAVRDDTDAYDIFLQLKDYYGIFICPNGGILKNRVFRIGHMGNLTFADYDKLVGAIAEILE